MNRATSAEEYKQISSFQTVSKVLLQERFADRMERPLAFWALPNDRRLPLAFLGRPLRDLLSTSFEELAATPGVGRKKIGTMLHLLHRATKDHPPAVPYSDSEPERKAAGSRNSRQEGAFDPNVVSEILWEQWRETVRRHGVGDHPLGRLTPSLQSLPTVIWQTPLSTYLDFSIAEIRQLKTHGEKRVRTILEVFHAVHKVLAHAQVESHLTVRLIPKFVPPLERWVVATRESKKIPSTDEVARSLAKPLLDQIQIDVGTSLVRLAEGRLSLRGDSQTVRQQSRRMGVTRARVYQLLEDCSKVMAVRWPDGRGQLAGLVDHLEALGARDGSLHLLRTTVDLFFVPPEGEHSASAGKGHESD
jgi:hypothetical protein